MSKAPRNPIVGFLVTHPNRGTKKHKDKKQAASVPTQKEVREILNSEGGNDGLSK